MATFNSQRRRAPKCGLAAVLFIFATGIVFAAGTNVFATKIEPAYQRAQIQFRLNPKNPTNAWQFARACFDSADAAKSDGERADIANQGISACRQLIARDPKIAAAHYYLAMNLGELARTKFLGALKIVREMESEFLTAVNLDADFDFAGPARNLGLLYREAPSFGSIGSRRKAREWLERALQLAPDYPENHLNLIESDLKWNERNAARIELKALDSVWPAAQKKFTGEKWAQSWNDWAARRAVAREKLGENSPVAQSPRKAVSP